MSELSVSWICGSFPSTPAYTCILLLLLLLFAASIVHHSSGVAGLGEQGAVVWFWGRGNGGRSLGGIVGRLRRTVGIPEVGRRQVCGEGWQLKRWVVFQSEERQCGQR